MKSELKEKKIVKTIRVNFDKCIGCRSCEVACSAFHANPKYSSINSTRSRIRVVTDELNDEYVPILAGGYMIAECAGRHTCTINGKEYSECSFCRASCHSRDLFKEPDSGLPLKCDMCETDPSLSEPWCVQVCVPDALTYEEREEEVEEEVREENPEEMQLRLRILEKQYGLDKIMATVARMSIANKS